MSDMSTTTPLSPLPVSATSTQATANQETESLLLQVDELANKSTHLSLSSPNDSKRDPFQFGSRYLKESDDVFEFNAWDHVIPDEAYYAYAEKQYADQRADPVSDFDKRRFNSEPAKWWDKFYSNNTSNFFRNRKWLRQEFPILSKLTEKDAGPATILEVGAGAGNTAFPILAANENKELMIHACDFSSKAVELIKANESYDTRHIRASIWDISGADPPPDLAEQSVDVVLLIFIFSALSPSQWSVAVQNVFRLLKPGGEVCFRDYGRGDLTQVRFKKGRLMEESFYIRGDGTRVYFFTEQELRDIWSGSVDPEGRSQATDTDSERPTATVALESSLLAFEIVSLGIDRRMLVNRQKQLKMYRCWMQGRFKKADLFERG